MNNNLENLDDLISTLNQAKKAHDLLEKIWIEIGPYRESCIGKSCIKNEEIMRDLRNYFNFDDSE